MEDATLFDRQLGESIHMIVIALRAGYPIRMILEKLAETLPQPIAGMYQALLPEDETEENIIEKLESLSEHIPSIYLNGVIATFLRHHNEGGNLADLLEPVAKAIIDKVGIDPDVREQAYILEQEVHAV